MKATADSMAVAAPPGQWSFGRGLRAAAARFWLGGVLMWSIEHAPWLARMTRPFFLFAAWHSSRFLRGNLLENAGHLLGADSTAGARRHVANKVLDNHWRFITDFGRMRHWPRRRLLDEIVQIDGERQYRRAQSSGRGIILVTAHLGSFEVGLAAIAEHARQVHVVFTRDTMATFDRLRSERRRMLGIIEAPLDDGLAVWLQLRDALRRNEVVLMQGDRVMPGQKGVTVDFLGAPMRLPTDPVRLAMATGAPIVPVFSLHTPDRKVRIVLEEPITVGDGRLVPAVRRLAKVIERHVSAHPDQWLMTHRAWEPPT